MSSDDEISLMLSLAEPGYCSLYRSAINYILCYPHGDYHPQTKLLKVMFSVVSVCLSVHKREESRVTITHDALDLCAATAAQTCSTWTSLCRDSPPPRPNVNPAPTPRVVRILPEWFLVSTCSFNLRGPGNKKALPNVCVMFNYQSSTTKCTHIQKVKIVSRAFPW